MQSIYICFFSWWSAQHDPLNCLKGFHDDDLLERKINEVNMSSLEVKDVPVNFKHRNTIDSKTESV